MYGPTMARRSDPRRRTTIHLMLTAGLIAVYSAVLLWTGPTSITETFPVFNWQLFSKVPHPVSTSYGVRILEVDGVPLDPPRYFEEAGDLFPNAKAPEAPTAAKAWGQHVQAGRLPEAAYVEELYEARFFSAVESVRYELVVRRYDVVERVECSCFLSEEVIGEFEYG